MSNNLSRETEKSSYRILVYCNFKGILFSLEISRSSILIKSNFTQFRGTHFGTIMIILVI